VKSWRTSELRPPDAHPSRGIVDLTLDAEIIGTAEGGDRRAFAAREYLSADDLLIPDNLRNGGRRRPWIPVGLGDNLDDEESDLQGSRQDRPKSLDYDGMQAADWLARHTSYIREEATSGLEAHRPASGVRVRWRIEERVAHALHELAIATPFDTLTATVRRGRLTSAEQTAHSDLARLVYTLLLPPPRQCSRTRPLPRVRPNDHLPPPRRGCRANGTEVR
jgi:hypothetical protein